MSDDYLQQYQETQDHILETYGVDFANNEYYVHALLLFNLLIHFENKPMMDKLSRILFPVGIAEDNIMITFQSLVQIKCVEDMLLHNDLKICVFENVLQIWTVTIFPKQQCYKSIVNYILEDEYTKSKYARQQNRELVRSTDSMYVAWVIDNKQFRSEYLSKRIKEIHQDIIDLHKYVQLKTPQRLK